MTHEGQQAASEPESAEAHGAVGAYHSPLDARALLDERYARGEIDRQQYLQQKADLAA